MNNLINETWNPISGCKPIGDGCDNCRAERMFRRLSAPNMPYHGRSFTDISLHEDRLQKPLSWTSPRRVFVCDMSDLFVPAVPIYFVYRVFAVMSVALWHQFQVVTKRPGVMWGLLSGSEAPRRIREEAARMGYPGRLIQWPLPNVWLGTSVENQAVVKNRLPMLRDTPAAVRFVMLEPLLEPVDLSGHEWLDWVVVGQETGSLARPFKDHWANDIHRFCSDNGIRFHHKPSVASGVRLF